MKSIGLFLVVIMGLIPIPVLAAETATYSYDAKGRLIKVVRTGTGATPVNVNVRVNYAHDKANNRKTVAVAR